MGSAVDESAVKGVHQEDSEGRRMERKEMQQGEEDCWS